jgi:hypothetical protein
VAAKAHYRRGQSVVAGRARGSNRGRRRIGARRRCHNQIHRSRCAFRIAAGADEDGFNEPKLPRSKSTVTWWSKVVNFISLCSLAAFRTPANPSDTLTPLCVGRVCGCGVFSLISGLPSSLSAIECSILFERFIGTMPLSDSSGASMRALRP